ncbi:oligopeptide/dipeptide ABC transporter ATP-binding protein [Methylobacterium sp. 17Sr1-1]|uniref:ABC transporter ATP-binding protein n=1 Tax=Methylobacterium sp. 17Sr1-1 TaxID=2202826 RepID=UPI000D7015D1|nr:oligopeptide/dipeptide ABC transporter ATP-binding protein [Methylobacterium sp. 17Sr1-1]AWN55242.1 ABC transporter ATP-binding protein [Methylobacterium sp. 17Sr1-1]
MTPPLLALEGVTQRFPVPVPLLARLGALLGRPAPDRAVHAVEAVDLAVARGETLGLVGESGCGKSTLGRIAAGIATPTRGAVLLDGEPVRVAGRKRTTRVQMVFQDPYASLDPRMRVGETLAEGPLAHGLTRPGEARATIAGWLTRVGLDPAAADRFPHQFSGGQRQRIAIARALAMRPDLLVCDEPVASLDVSIQAQIVNLFLSLRREFGLTMVFISHDLGVVRHLCDRIAIMYLGRIVEIGPAAEIATAARHPYTRALLASVPRLVTEEGEASALEPIHGDLPSPLDRPEGCPYRTRCPLAVARCRTEPPRLRPLGAVEVACHRAEEVGGFSAPRPA